MKPILVTTKYRGVFFGYLDGEPDKLPKEITLTDAQNCVYWSKAERGVFGLAAQGPDADCRIGPKVPQLTIYDVTSVADCTPEAAEKWKLTPWS